MEYKTTVGDYSQKIDLKTNIKNETTIEVSMTKFDGAGTSALYFSTSVGRIRLKEVVTTDKTLGHYSMESFIKIGSEKFYITSIDTYAFEKNKLTGITIGKKVKTIKKKAFANQKKLKLIEITAEKLKSVGKNAFKGISKKAVFKIKGSDKDYERVKELIIKSGVSSTVTIKHI